MDLSSDRAEIEWIARDRTDRKRSSGVKTKMRWKPQTYEVNLQTVKSEFGVCRGAGVSPDITRRYGRDPGYDLVYLRYLVEVKYTEWKSGHLVYNPAEHEYEQDIWTLAILSKDIEDYSVKLAGWIWRFRMNEVWEPCFFDEGAHCVCQRDLNPFKYLLRLQPKGVAQLSLF